MADIEAIKPCPNETQHARHPSSYIGHSCWAEQMLLTHRQRVCKGCGGWEIWEPIDPEKLSAPAIVDGECSRCRTYYDEGALIRTDGNGDWIALTCCPPTTTEETNPHA